MSSSRPSVIRERSASRSREAEQNPGAAWQDLLGGIEVAADTGGVADQQVDADDSDEFASFKM